MKIHLPMQGTCVDPWSWKIPYATEQLSLCTTITEAHVARARALQQEKSLQWEARALQEQPLCSQQLEKTHAKQHSAAKNKQIKFLKI